ncbi:hypothetical protein AYI70_g5439 [Smittium culicis]|uniref:Uncharacterized protein n=1 Tax=Smittium culicis TaxID=133412 RepID=A0A1R1XUJ3_9FUNG|nr:hypothetical protein AYI70_g5439 [Smittium culicis]
MEQALLDTIAMLTKKVEDLLVRQDANTVEDDCTDQYVSTRALAIYLQTYARLMEALPSIEVDFFRSPLSDEEKRDIVQSNPRTVDMIYTPPPINDAVTAPTKKLDTAYYNLLQDEPEAPANDSRFLFSSTMRLLLSEACTLLTQARLDNLHSGLNLPERPLQLNPSANEPLVDPAILSELISTKMPTKSGGKKSFRGRQHQAASQAAPKTVTIAATAPVTNQTNLAYGSNQQLANYIGGFRGGRGGGMGEGEGTPPVGGRLHQFQEAWGWLTSDCWLQETIANGEGNDVGDCGSIVKKGNRESIHAITGILLEYIHGSKEIRGNSSCSGHEATERTPEEDTFQNGIPDVHHQVDPQQGLLVINQPYRCLSKHPYKEIVRELLALSMERESIPVPGPTIWDVPITAGFYQNPPSSNTMGPPERDQNVHLPGRPPDNGVVKRRMFEINNVCFEKAGPTRLQNQRIKIIFSGHAVHSAPRYEDQHQVHDAPGTRKQGPRPPENSNRNDKSRYGYNQSHCVICLQGPGDDSGDTSGAPEAPQTYGVEDQLFEGQPEMDIDSHNNGASIRESDLVEGPSVLMEWELLPSRNSRTGDIYRCQRHWLGGRCWISDLLRLLARAPYKIAYHCKRISENINCGSSPLSCWKLGIRLLRQYHNISIRLSLKSVSNEPGRCTIEDDYTDRIFDFSNHLQGNPGPLILRQGTRRNRRLHAATVSMEERVLLPTVELDPSSDSESLQVTVDTNTSNPTVAIGNVVFRTNKVGYLPTNVLTGNSGGARPQKRQVAFDEEQVLVFNGLEHKRRALSGQGLEDQAIEIILSNPRTDKRIRHYDPTQQRFLAWRIRYIIDFTKPLSVDSISRHVHMLSDLILRPPNTPRPKARALGPALAAAAGVPSSDIVAQAFWSNYYMFDNYYRLSRSTNSNISEYVLPLE